MEGINGKPSFIFMDIFNQRNNRFVGAAYLEDNVKHKDTKDVYIAEEGNFFRSATIREKNQTEKVVTIRGKEKDDVINHMEFIIRMHQIGEKQSNRQLHTDDNEKRLTIDPKLFDEQNHTFGTLKSIIKEIENINSAKQKNHYNNIFVCLAIQDKSIAIIHKIKNDIDFEYNVDYDTTNVDNINSNINSFSYK